MTNRFSKHINSNRLRVIFILIIAYEYSNYLFLVPVLTFTTAYFI